MSVKSKSHGMRLPTLRFRAKIVLGFSAVLAILAVSMALAYLGFERVANAVSSYRGSVAEADLVRTVDRELISYQGLARTYTLTGTDADEAATHSIEESLRASIDRSVTAAIAPERREQLARLQAQFHSFAKLFGEIVTLTRANNKIASEELNDAGSKIQFKFDDLGDTAALTNAAADQAAIKDVTSQSLSVTTSVSAFTVRPELKAADGILGRIRFLTTSVGAISSDDQKITQWASDIGGLLKRYRASFAKFVENANAIAKRKAEPQFLHCRKH
ncbi:hypothetical protein GCM10007857_25940 [Bradyrhizobium iriomotense]|uniref:HBM domain-containing protein n=1 Tax=Bradyrhizobium iriomotense TaxID=441950 RepID=A0ABQ6B136_9BRAD|nr:hypothetical protein GCM10007857_25940 [Bradyrhizobium iriomotense]